MMAFGAVVAIAAAIYVVARKVREHRRLLDGRIDQLAREVEDIASRADARSDFLTAELTATHRRAVHAELRAKADHLMHLLALGRDTGRLEEERVNQLRATLVAWRDEVSD